MSARAEFIRPGHLWGSFLLFFFFPSTLRADHSEVHEAHRDEAHLLELFTVGYDRGHLVPNAVIGNQYGSLAQMETFYMTNMCPQKKALNRGAWMRLEKWVIKAAEQKDHIFVIAGPIFGTNTELVPKGPERGIELPEAFYMILVDASREWLDRPTIKTLAYRFSQDTARDADFMAREPFGVSINEIEAATQLDFFPDFTSLFSHWEEREDRVETTHWALD